MNVEDHADLAASSIAAAIGEPARARMLYSLMDGHARTSPPNRLRAARTCYDHMAGGIAVALHDRLLALGWLTADAADDSAYELTAKGVKALEALGVDVTSVRAMRRRFAYACVDWSERRPHVGGAIGAALLDLALRKRWVEQDRDSRALTVTKRGARELQLS